MTDTTATATSTTARAERVPWYALTEEPAARQVIDLRGPTPTTYVEPVPAPGVEEVIELADPVLAEPDVPTLTDQAPDAEVAAPEPAAAPEPSTTPHVGWRPRVRSFLVAIAVLAVYSVWSFEPSRRTYNWALTVIWSMPIVSTMIGLQGAFLLRRRVRHDERRPPAPTPVPERLVVVVPTIGRLDTLPALERSVRSFLEHLPALFPAVRCDVVVEEGCAAADRIQALADADPRVRVVTVPRDWQTPRGTRFKARANQYAADLRRADGEAGPDVWVLHMDDDTGVGPDTAVALARFIARQRVAGPDAKLLAQGILSYPRENAANWFTWMADAVRPADDVTRFRALTGAGTPIAGLHGELLLIRADVEQEIGWDFGPRSIVEDAEFALHFARRHPGRSDWFNGRSYGASPATLRDLLRQRERWAWGLIGLVASRRIPLRHKAFLAWLVLTWVLVPLQHVGVVLLIGRLIGVTSASPVVESVLVLWSLNYAFVVWGYWEGLRLNGDSSHRPGRRWYEPPLIVLLIPVFGFVEGLGALRGLLKFLARRENTFVVIAKPV